MLKVKIGLELSFAEFEAYKTGNNLHYSGH